MNRIDTSVFFSIVNQTVEVEQVFGDAGMLSEKNVSSHQPVVKGLTCFNKSAKMEYSGGDYRSICAIDSCVCNGEAKCRHSPKFVKLESPKNDYPEFDEYGQVTDDDVPFQDSSERIRILLQKLEAEMGVPEGSLLRVVTETPTVEIVEPEVSETTSVLDTALLSHPLTAKWMNIHAQCYEPTNPKYKKVGAMGIKVCQEWHDHKTFIEAFPNYEPLSGQRFVRKDRSKDFDPSNYVLIDKKY